MTQGLLRALVAVRIGSADAGVAGWTAHGYVTLNRYPMLGPRGSRGEVGLLAHLVLPHRRLELLDVLG